MKPRLRWLLRLIGALAVLGVVAGLALLLVGWARHNQAVELPRPAGPYAVGRVDYDWVDESRPEIFTPNPNDHRELPASIWYPVLAEASASPVLPYGSKKWQEAEAQEHGALLGAFMTQNLAKVRAHAVSDGPPAPSGQPYPVIIFQPGLGPSHPDYTTLAEDLASRGYVVVATTPAYSANVTVFPDGRSAERVDAATVSDSAAPAAAKVQLDKLIEVWSADDVFVMNKLEALDAGNPDARFAGKLDLNAIGVMGHSFGGASAAETCHLDARCKAGVDLDGSPYGTVVDAGLALPFLFMWSTPDFIHQDAQAQALEDVQTLVAHSQGPIYELTVQGARHFNFSDYAVLYEPALRPMQMLGPIDGRRGLAITSAYVAAFFDQYLKNRPQTLLQGPSADYPDVHFEVHRGG